MKTSYADKLKDPRWQKKRLTILERDQWSCQMCVDTETQLQVHHKQYSGEPWEAPDEDLITLCSHCHHTETELAKSGDSLVFAFKENNGYFCKTRKKHILMGIISPEKELSLKMKLTKPLVAIEILKSLAANY